MNPSQQGIYATKATTPSLWTSFGSISWSTSKPKPKATAAVGLTMLAGFITAYNSYNNSNFYTGYHASSTTESIRNTDHIQPSKKSLSTPAVVPTNTASMVLKQEEQEQLRTKEKAIELLSKDKTDCNCVPLWECMQRNVGGEVEMDVDQAMNTPAVKTGCHELEAQLRMCMAISKAHASQLRDARE